MGRERGEVPATDLSDVLAELRDQEPIFHRSGAEALDDLMAPDYWEVGASGRVYTRAFVRETLLERYASGVPDPPWETWDFAVRPVGPDTYLLTYALRQGDRRTRRATVWHRTPTGWQAEYHQGTAIEGGDP